MSTRQVYIGIDNGVTGSIGVINKYTALLYATPTKSEQSYTKKKQNVTRIDTISLRKILEDCGDARVMIERPMVNPSRYKSTLSAMRALEATLVVVESLAFGYEYVDSKEWQKALVPQGISGAELKPASATIGKRLYPHLSDEIDKQGDADGILIAHYLYLKYNKL